MLYNYLTIALRNLRKNGLYSFLNIFGLSVGIAACMLIALYVVNELGYDRWNPHADRIMRIVSNINFGGSEMKIATSGALVGPEATREMPEIQTWVRFRERGSYLVRRDGSAQSNIREEKVLSVDSTFFEVFPLKILEGNATQCLNQPNTIAISKSRAEKYFSVPQMAVGQTLVLENKDRYQITAVFEDMPENSHFRANLLISLVNDDEIKESPPFWGTNNNFHTYLLLRKGTDKAVFAQKFDKLCREKFAITAQQMLGTTLDAFEKSGQYVRFVLQNLPDIHLHSDLNVELSANGNIGYVWIFSAIAAFILLIACINFMNLATARSSMRAKEIGVRKTLGSRRTALMGQFLTESILLALFSTLFAIVLATLVMPAYRNLTDRELNMPWESPMFWAATLGGAGLVGLLAGSYPAFYLSTFNAVKVLKGDVASSGKKSSRLRSSLVVFQFSISVILILCTLSVFRQLNYIQTKKLGFEKDQVVILDNAYALGDRIYTYKEEMLKNPLIENATISGFLPVPSFRSDRGFMKKKAIDMNEIVEMQYWWVDSDYFGTLGIELKQGRFFDPARMTDSAGVILNESAVKQFGLDDPIGKKIYTLAQAPQGPPKPEDYIEMEIIGVAKDFHWASLRDHIEPVSFVLQKSRGMACFRYKGNDTEAVIDALEKQWKNMAPDQPFDYRFMDDAFGKVYSSEQRVGRLAGLFALFSVLISCLGLLGLSAFTAEQRTKEIGVRKVLGASVTGIVALLAKDFLKLVLIAILIASPLAYYFMQKWLSDFAYHIDIQWWMFAGAGVLALLIAFLTVGGQAMKAALMNPVKSLRSE